jgi:hypothetical protein
MMYFTISGDLSGRDSNRSMNKIKEIQITDSDEYETAFLAKNWSGAGHYIHVYYEDYDVSKQIGFKNEQDSATVAINKPLGDISTSAPRRKVKNISWVIHSHMLVRFPGSALEGIYDPPIYYCKTKEDRKKYQNYIKLYRSQDRLRMYMLNGRGKDRYEVIWVVNDHMYYNRFINKVPE